MSCLRLAEPGWVHLCSSGLSWAWVAAVSPSHLLLILSGSWGPIRLLLLVVKREVRDDESHDASTLPASHTSKENHLTKPHIKEQSRFFSGKGCKGTHHRLWRIRPLISFPTVDPSWQMLAVGLSWRPWLSRSSFVESDRSPLLHHLLLYQCLPDNTSCSMDIKRAVFLDCQPFEFVCLILLFCLGFFLYHSTH